jgi:2-hydroxychromene-2-carboxylate isomerase
MQSAAVKDRLVRENEEAIRKGVFGSPFFHVDGEPFWGSDRLALLAQP